MTMAKQQKQTVDRDDSREVAELKERVAVAEEARRAAEASAVVAQAAFSRESEKLYTMSLLAAENLRLRQQLQAAR